MKLNKFFKFPWYVFFLVLYAILSLLTQNLGQVDSSVVFRSLLVSLAPTYVAMLLVNISIRDIQQAGLIVAFLAVLFFSYGHVYLAIKNLQLGEILVGRHRFLIFVWLLFAVVGVWGILKKQQSETLTGNLNFILFILLLFPLIQITLYELKNVDSQSFENIQRGEPISEDLPDVYYIILDAYGRSDVLKENIGYDNTSFLNDLEELGFYVANCSQGNYSNTEISLASSLNFNYLNQLSEELTAETTDRSLVWGFVKHNAVLGKFISFGYTIHAFQTEFSISDVEPVDFLYVAPQRGFNDFEGLLIQTTAAILLEDAGLFNKFHFTADDAKYHRTLYTLDRLKEIPQSPGPNFVFAHILLPHQRFVFGPDGEMELVQKFSSNKAEYYSTESYIRGYKNQAIYISNTITEIAKEIIESSPTPPVIIIQGDHGPSHFSEADRLGILNAYYFPEKQVELYPTITPVNTFRLLFNTYFNEDNPLLDDISVVDPKSWTGGIVDTAV